MNALLFAAAAVATLKAAPSSAAIESAAKWDGPPVRVHIVPHTVSEKM